MKAIIAGGRSYYLTRDDYSWLNTFRGTVAEVVSGGATGADACGEGWAHSNGIPVTTKKPDAMGGILPFWQAAKIRNQQMADYADILIAFPGSKGTDDMVSRAEAKGMLVYRSPGYARP